jgi:transcriptional regulator NrdR family protein
MSLNCKITVNLADDGIEKFTREHILPSLTAFANAVNVNPETLHDYIGEIEQLVSENGRIICRLRPVLRINDIADRSGDDMLEFEIDHIEDTIYLRFIQRLKG